MTNKEKLDKLAGDKKSSWYEKASERRKNRGWLRKSQKIALKVLQVLKERGITQKELAGQLGITPQQVNKIVKGSENLGLETITRIEEVLDTTLIEIPEFQLEQKVKPVCSPDQATTLQKKRAYKKTFSSEDLSKDEWSPDYDDYPNHPKAA